MKNIYISGVIGYDITALDFMAKLKALGNEPLRIIINSPGGFVDEGIEIYNALKMYKGDLEVVVGAMAGSIASYIALSAPAEKRKGFKNSSFMIHEASGGGFGRARDMQIVADRLEGINSIIAETYAEELGYKDVKAARKDMSEDKYFTGWEQLLERGIISDLQDYDEIGEVEVWETENNFWSIFALENVKNENEKQVAEFIAKTKMYNAEEKAANDIKRQKSMIEKAVALIGGDDKIKRNQPVEKQDENKIEQEVIMTLQEFLKTNPDAKAEYDKDLISAKAQAISEIEKLSAEDKQRTVKILQLEGVKLSENAIEALDGKIDVVSYMEKQLMAQREKRQQPEAEKVSPFQNLLAPQTPREQAQETAQPPEKKRAMTAEEIDANAKALAKQMFGGSK